MRTKSIKVTRASQVAVIWLDRPSVCNAIDALMVRELDGALAALDTDAAVRAVVIAGRGAAFCAGVDVRWLKHMAGSRLVTNGQDAFGMARLLHRLDSMKKPTVARVHGAAYADGLGLIAACDIAVSSLNTDFCVSETRHGLAPVATAPYLVRAMGERQARRYLLSGEVFTAAEAYRIGLLHELAPEEDLDAKVNEILGHLSLCGPLALVAAKEIIAQVSGSQHSQTPISSLESRSATLLASSEASEGINAFLEKRHPIWNQRRVRATPQKKPSSDVRLKRRSVNNKT